MNVLRRGFSSIFAIFKGIRLKENQSTVNGTKETQKPREYRIAISMPKAITEIWFYFRFQCVLTTTNTMNAEESKITDEINIIDNVMTEWQKRSEKRQGNRRQKVQTQTTCRKCFLSKEGTFKRSSIKLRSLQCPRFW